MTVQEMIEDVYLRLGEITWISPYDSGGLFDINQDGAQRVLGWLNRGYKTVANWKLPRGTLIRFPSLAGRMFLKVRDVSAGVDSATDDTVVLDSSVFGTDNRYNEWIINAGASGTRTIIDFVGSSRTATVDRDWDSNPENGDSVTLFKRFFPYNSGSANVHSGEELPKDANEVIAIQRVFELNSRRELTRSGRSENHISTETVRSNPTVFWQREDGVEFDIAPTADTSYEILYYGAPEELTTGDQTPKIPEAWHEALVTFALWKGLETRKEFDGAYAMKRNLVDFMQSGKQPMEMAFEREDAFLEWEPLYGGFR